MAIDGRQKIADADAMVDDLLAGAIGGTDSLAAADEQRSGARPMIVPRLNGSCLRAGRAFAAAGDIAEPADAKQEAFLTAISMLTSWAATT